MTIPEINQSIGWLKQAKNICRIAEKDIHEDNTYLYCNVCKYIDEVLKILENYGTR